MANGGRIPHPNALPNYRNAVIPSNKLERYSLDPTHPRGKHKAVVFRSALGFVQSDWAILKQSILDALPYYEAIASKEDSWGKRYKVVLPISGPNGNTADVVVTWIIKAGTDYPSLDSTWVK